MDGILAVVSNSNKYNVESLSVDWKQNFSFQHAPILRTISKESYFIQQKTSQKFLSEKKWLETDDFIFVTDGVILNFDLLLSEEGIDSDEELISVLATRGKTFFDKFEGSFVGFYYDKNLDIWYVFNNQTGTKKMFYFQNNDCLIFSTDLLMLIKALSSINISFTLDNLSAYILLTSGFMLDNLTLITEVKQLRAGEYLVSNQSKLMTDYYFHLQHIKQTTDSKATILFNLNQKFNEAIKLEFDMDLKHGYPHTCTLSGGLDSRMTTLLAHKLGYENIQMISFSEKGYADEYIAKQIAKTYDLNLHYESTDPNSLLEIEKVLLVNDGQVVYTNCSHVFDFIKRMQYNTVGCIHTGMIGDAVLGSFLSAKKEIKASEMDGIYGKKIRFPQVQTYIRKLNGQYKNEELYKFYNRAFMGANNGYLYFDLIGHTISPFLNTDFFSYAYSIPLKYKYKQAIYIDWIKKFHPELAEFTWETIGGKPTNNTILRTIYRINRAIVKRLPIQTIWKNNMTPEQFWYDNNKNIRIELDNFFYSNIDCINDPILRDDVMKLYKTNDITEKAKCLTLIGAVKLLFQ